MSRVIVGVDPHKKSVTIEAVDDHATVLATGRFGTDTNDYRLMLRYVRRQWPHHRWAVEGANGVGRPLAQRLLAEGENVVDVPAKLAARVRVFDTGNARKTDAVDAHAVAMVAVRRPRLKQLAYDEELIALRLLTDRRDELSHLRVQTVNRLQRLLTELIAGGAKRDLSALQAKRLLASVRPRTLVGKTLRRMAAEELTDLVAVDAKLKAINKELRAGVQARGSQVKADPAVELASLNYIRHKSATPNDPLYANYQKYLPTVRVNQAWDLSKSAGSQTIAVLDTGVDAGHPDLAGHLLPGYNLFNTALPPNDGDGHGTAVAGIIAAGTGNGAGIAGLAWDAKIRPVKVLDDNGTGSDGKLVMGINWAVTVGARVINMSLGSEQPSSVLQDAIQNAVAKGVLVVAAAGNTGTAEFPQYPAAYPEVLSVGATNGNGVLTSFSSTGPTIDIAAPGFGITSTAPRALTPAGSSPYFIELAGTSFAAPIVAGAAALVRNKWPSLTPAQVIERLKSTARDAGPRGTDVYYGAGVLDAYHALGGSWAPDFAPGTPDANDLPVRAVAIEPDGYATGSIGTEGDLDWYKITTSFARTLCVEVNGPVYDSSQYAQNFAPVLTVYDASLKSVTWRQQRYPGDNIGVEQPGPSGLGIGVELPVGTTYLSVRNYNGSRDNRAYKVDTYNCSRSDMDPAMDAYPVIDAQPIDQSAVVALDVKPSITFARPVQADSVTATTVRLLNVKTGATVGATVTYDADANAAVLSPSSSLLDNTPYRVAVNGVIDGVSANYLQSFSSLFTTVDLAPAKPDFEAGGAYLAANLSWKIPVMSDLDQVIVRRNPISTVPTLTTGSLVYAGTAAAVKNTGLAQGVTYTYAVWVKDRSGKVSPAAVKQLLGMKSGISTTSTLVSYGGSITIKGSTLRIDNKAYAGLPVNVYVRPKNSSKFALLAALKTTSTGTVAVTHKPVVSSVYMLTFPGNADLMGTRTADITVQVAPTISATLAPAAVRLGQATAFSGYVAPAHAGQTVYLQQYGSKVWKSIATVKLSTSGRYAFGIKPATRGQIAYRVWFPGDADHAQALTANKILTIS